jgi:hypothetical protein
MTGTAVIHKKRGNEDVLWTRFYVGRVADGRLVYARIIHFDFIWSFCMVFFETPANNNDTDLKLSELFQKPSGKLFPLPTLR